MQLQRFRIRRIVEALDPALTTNMTQTKNKSIAIIGAGMAGITAARTLDQAGHHVTVFEKSRGFGGRMSSRRSAFGSFDHGTQYFTARDPQFLQMIAWANQTASGLVQAWDAKQKKSEQRLVATPGMSALATHIARPLADQGKIHLQHRVQSITRDNSGWAIKAIDNQEQEKERDYAGFDQIILAIPSIQANALLLQTRQHSEWVSAIDRVVVAPCWTLMLAFPNADKALGPAWNASHSEHKRVSWVARESSKPTRTPIERWTVQANAAWSERHLEDDPQRVKEKLMKAFAEITGIHAQPPHAEVHRWRYAITQKPLGKPFLWDSKNGIGICGDWCIGHRVEDAFISGLRLAYETQV